MSEREYDLKLSTGAVVQWHGKDGPDAAERYVDTNPAATVVATRLAASERYGIRVGHRHITEPGDDTRRGS